MYPQDLQNRATRVRLVVFDVDGVLTDGQLYYSSDGSEIKAFHVQDGAALKLLQRSGLEVAIITGRQSTMVARRAEELGISLLRQRADDKLQTLKSLLNSETSLNGITLAECACVGDDLADIALFEAVGLGIAVPNGHPSSHKAAHWITSTPGGQGVASEVCEMLLRSQGLWPYP